ncbi:MAG TPA: hypothetical protein VJ785_10305 [Anaerolineales bacterium]|nr:hypothetical protein [Anaerolineales bacterium]
MLLKIIRIPIVLLCLLALAVPSPAAADETPPAQAFVSTEVNPLSLHIGETASVSVKLNNVPVEGYKSAEFTCTYDAGLIEKGNLAVTDLFGVEPVVAIHEPQTGSFIVAIAGSNSNRAMTSGPVFTFSAKGLQAGQSVVQCAARLSAGDNIPIDVPLTGASLTIQPVEILPTPSEAPISTPIEQENPIPTSIPPELPTPVPSPNGFVSGQVIASKPVTVRLLDANRAEITSVVANPDGTFNLTALAGTYTLLATASGFLSHQGSFAINAGETTLKSVSHLLAGDVDGNHVIDQFDALTIGMSYTSSIPEAANLNNDALIDFLDLELLAENYHQTGPSVWE